MHHSLRTASLGVVLQCGTYSPETVLEIFKRVDADQDGVLTGQEAVAFFSTAGLTRQQLADVWERASRSEPGGLDLVKFSHALRLVSLLQTGCVFTEEFIVKALHPVTGLQLPTPRFGQQYLSDPPPANGGLGTPPPASRVAKPGRPADVAADGAAKGLSRLHVGSVPTDASPEPERQYREEPGSGVQEDDAVSGNHQGATQHVPATTFRLDVRASPHNSALAAQYALLCAGNGLLFAAPTRNGGFACYGRAETKVAEMPALDWPALRNGEDPESLHGKEARLERVACGPVACMHWCDFVGMLVTGHADGKVVVWHVADDGKQAPEARAIIKAHQGGSVSAVVTTPWGALLTGSAGGSLRLWSAAMCEARAATARAHSVGQYQSRELRRSNGERAHVCTKSLALSSGGQFVYAAGRGSINIWDSQSGVFLGNLCTFRQAPAGALDVDPACGIITDASTGRAVCGPQAVAVPPLGAILAAPAGQDEVTYSIKLGAARDAASRVASKVAQRGLQGVKAMMASKQWKGAGGEQQVGSPPLASLGHDVGGSFRAASGASVEAAECDGAEDDAPVAAAVKAKLACVACTLDNCLWVASKESEVEVFAANGRFLSRLCVAPCAATCALCVGHNVWFGFADGRLIAYDWRHQTRSCAVAAHASPVVGLAQVGMLVYSLGADGALVGHNAFVMPREPAEGPLAAAPERPPSGVWQDEWRRVLDAWVAKLPESIEMQTVGMRLCTWNVNESRPHQASLECLVGADAGNTRGMDDVDMVVVGLQEVEMGTASVAMGAVKERMNRKGAELGNQNARWWSEQLLTCLRGYELGDMSSVHAVDPWYHVGMRQLSGMLLVVLARKTLRSDVTHVLRSAVGCGIGGFGGNKGGVAISLRLHRHHFLIINSHFAAHQSAVDKRNADYATILKRLQFKDHLDVAGADDAGADPASGGLDELDSNATMEEAAAAVSVAYRGRAAESAAFKSAKLVVWMGDFNYRIGLDRDTVDTAIQAGAAVSHLKQHDQARNEMAAGHVFQGFREGPITFNPTYKFDKGATGLLAYDTSEKRRVPAWTDRIFFKGSVPFPRLRAPTEEIDFSETAPARQVAGLRRDAADQVVVRCLEYASLRGVCDSDHKPVFAHLSADIPAVDLKRRRKDVSKLLSQFHAAMKQHYAPHIQLASHKLVLRRATKEFRLENHGHGDAFFTLRAWGGSLEGHGAGQPCALAPWLNFQPTSGCVPAKGWTDVTVTVNKATANYLQDDLSSDQITAHVYLVVDGFRKSGVPVMADNSMRLEVSFGRHT